LGPILLVWLSFGAAAEDFRAWQGVHEGLLIESADGDLVAAARWYESLIASVPDNDPARAELYYQLGRARYALGDVPGAQTALAVAQADPLLEERASVLLDQIEAQKNPIRTLPYTMDLSQPSFPWRRAWSPAHGCPRRLAPRSPACRHPPARLADAIGRGDRPHCPRDRTAAAAAVARCAGARPARCGRPGGSDGCRAGPAIGAPEGVTSTKCRRGDRQQVPPRCNRSSQPDMI